MRKSKKVTNIDVNKIDISGTRPFDDQDYELGKVVKSTKDYGDKLRSPHWQKKRLEIFNRDDWQCRLCDDKETELQVHHKKYTVSDPWKEKDENLITLCSDCHSLITKYKDNLDINFKRVIKYRRQTGSIVSFIIDTNFISIIDIENNYASMFRKDFFKYELLKEL